MVKSVLVGAWLMAAGIYDLRYQKIPAWMLLLGGVGVLAQVFCGGGAFWREWQSILCGCLPGALILGISLTTGRVGTADGIVLLYLGFLYGKNCLMIYVFSLLLVSIRAGIMLAGRRTGQKAALQTLPYLPFMAAAWFLERLI